MSNNSTLLTPILLLSEGLIGAKRKRGDGRESYSGKKQIRCKVRLIYL
jgi:hypothetical protein